MDRQYIGEIGKTDNGIVVVTTHLYDGKKSLPLDIELYQQANSLPEGKENPEFKKKPELAIKLIDLTLKRGYQPGIIIVDAGYGNNTSFLLELEKRQLKYLGALAKNHKVTVTSQANIQRTIRLDELAQSLPQDSFTEIQFSLDKQKTLLVVTREVEVSQLKGKRNIAIVMNAATFSEATDVDYFITNISTSLITPEWIVNTYCQRNWVEVFYREAKGWLGLKEYQVRGKKSLLRHFIFVFCAYNFIFWHQRTGGLRRRWASKPLNTFPEALAGLCHLPHTSLTHNRFFPDSQPFCFGCILSPLTFSLGRTQSNNCYCTQAGSFVLPNLDNCWTIL